MHSLYAVENAVSVACRSCSRPIDIWTHHGIELGRAGVTKHPDSARRLCPECLLCTFPAEDRERPGQAYELLRDMAREAGIPPGVTTYLFHSEGKPGSWSHGYQAVGLAVHIREWDLSSPVRPHLTVIPDDPNERPFSFVIFVARVQHCGVHGAYLKGIWPFHDLALLPRLEIVGGFDEAVSEKDLNKLVRGRRFWKETMIGRGRLPGTGRWESGTDFFEEMDAKLREFEQSGRRVGTMDMLADAMGTSRRTLFTMFRDMPEARNRFREHQRKRPRR